MKNKGLTLIELLLGLVIFSVIALSAYSILSGGLRLNRRADDQNLVYREANLAFDLISRDLENAIYYNFENSYPDQIAFKGEKNLVEFIHATDEGLKVISYYLVIPQSDKVYKTIIGQTYRRNVDVVTGAINSKRANYLVRQEQLLTHYLSDGFNDKKEIEIIATHIKSGSLRFLYGYVQGEDESEYVWKDQWDQSHLPYQIRIKMDFLLDKKESPDLSLAQDVIIPIGRFGGTE